MRDFVSGAYTREPAPIGSDMPLRAEGLVQAIREALAEAELSIGDCDHRIADINGEQYAFKEAALAVARLLRSRKVKFSIWHPADCIGEIGAAALPTLLSTLFYGARNDYLPGPTFVGHVGNDDGKRAAFITQATIEQTLALEALSEAGLSTERANRLS